MYLSATTACIRKLEGTTARPAAGHMNPPHFEVSQSTEKNACQDAEIRDKALTGTENKMGRMAPAKCVQTLTQLYGKCSKNRDAGGGGGRRWIDTGDAGKMGLFLRGRQRQKRKKIDNPQHTAEG